MQRHYEVQTPMAKALHERALRVLAPCVYGSPLGRSGSPIVPIGTPYFFSRAKGARLWDVDGREYIDFMCALGPNLFGYGDDRVEGAAARQRELGDTMTGPAPVMVELAEKLVDMVSHADWALFAKNGVDVISVALRMARAQTGRRAVLVATGSYHGAHSWCTPVTEGVLAEERSHRIEYRYNDLDSLNEAAAACKGDIAAIFATAFKHDLFSGQELPTQEYARRCRQICDDTGALLVVDDIRAGFRLARDCTWEILGVRPDLSCWSKALANGYALSALLGSGNVSGGAKRILATGTYWVQAVPMAAAVATLNLIRETTYLEHTVRLGSILRDGLASAARAHDFELSQTGPVQMPMILFKDDPDFRFAMAFASGMVRRGIYIAPTHNMFLCAALNDSDIAQTIETAETVLMRMAESRRRIEPHYALKRFLDGTRDVS